MAATPETVKKLIGAGFAVTVEAGAGAAASYPDADYAAAGATLAKTAQDAIGQADILFKVRAPVDEEIAALKAGAIVAATLNPYVDKDALKALAAKGATAFAHGVRAADHPRAGHGRPAYSQANSPAIAP